VPSYNIYKIIFKVQIIKFNLTIINIYKTHKFVLKNMQKFYHRHYLLKIEALGTLKTTVLVSIVLLCKLNLNKKNSHF